MSEKTFTLQRTWSKQMGKKVDGSLRNVDYKDMINVIQIDSLSVAIIGLLDIQPSYCLASFKGGDNGSELAMSRLFLFCRNSQTP